MEYRTATVRERGERSLRDRQGFLTVAEVRRLLGRRFLTGAVLSWLRAVVLGGVMR
jgi:hypothetical protein